MKNNESDKKASSEASSLRLKPVWNDLFQHVDVDKHLDNLPATVKTWCTCSCVSDQPHVVVGGCGRSGTNLLRSMLCQHPDLCGGPETFLFVPKLPTTPTSLWLQRHQTPPWALELADLHSMSTSTMDRVWNASCCQVSFADNFAKALCDQHGKSRWVEKTPKNVGSIGWIFDKWPKAKFVHVVRDGRDVVCSLRTHPKWKMLDNGQRVPTGIVHDVETCARRWVTDVREGCAWSGHLRYGEVRYEDLVRRPKPTLKKLLSWLRVSWDNSVLEFWKNPGDLAKNPQAQGTEQPIYTDSLGRWRRDLTAKEKTRVKALVTDTLVMLGYVSGTSWR